MSGPSPSEIHSKVVDFVQRLQPRKIGSDQKQRIRDFHKWFDKVQPALDPKDIQLLLVGTGDQQGLLVICGGSNLKSLGGIKKAGALALELVRYFMSDRNKHFNIWIETFTQVATLPLIQAMRLDKHILGDTKICNPETAYYLIDIIHQQNQRLSVEEYVQDSDARMRYEDWVRQHEAVAAGAAGGGAEEGESESEGEPQKWADIKELEDPEKDEDEEGLPVVEEEEEETISFRDPLGIKGSLDDLVRRMDAEKRKKKTRTKRRDLSLLDEDDQGSIHTSYDDFDPILFLTTVHSESSYFALEKGQYMLAKAVENKTGDVRKLVREHFRQYVSCKDTIDTIHQLIKVEVTPEEEDKSQIKPLESVLARMLGEGQGVFSSMLARRAHMEKIRQTISTLQRFKFLLALLGEIRRNIAFQQYSKVVRDYKKAKSIRIDESKSGQRGSSPLPSQILDQVMKQIDVFRQFLFRKLDPPPVATVSSVLAGSNSSSSSDVAPGASGGGGGGGVGGGGAAAALSSAEEKQRIIAYLCELDCDEDPAWYYLTKQKEWICKLLEKCYMEYELGDLIQRRRNSLFSTPLRGGSRRGSMVPVEDNDKAMRTLVHHLCQVLTTYLPGFVHLAHRVTSGRFSSSAGGDLGEPPSPSTASTTMTASLKTDMLRIDVFQRAKPLLLDIFAVFVKYIRFVFFPQSTAASGAAGSEGEEGRDDLFVSPARKLIVAIPTQVPAGQVAPGGSQAGSDAKSRTPRARGGSNASVPTGPVVTSPSLDDSKRGVMSPSGAGTSSSGSSSGSSASTSKPQQQQQQQQQQSHWLPVSGFVDMGSLMHESVLETLNTFLTVKQLAIPGDYLNEIRVISSDVVRYWVSQTFTNTLVLVSQLKNHEDWRHHPDIPGITCLPHRFKELMEESIKAMTAIPLPKTKMIVELMGAPFLECFRVFADVLYQLAMRDATSSEHVGEGESVSSRQGFSVVSGSGSSSSASASASASAGGFGVDDLENDELNQQQQHHERKIAHRRILAVMSNVVHTKNVLLPPLCRKFRRMMPEASHPALNHAFRGVEDLLDTLEMFIRNQYVRTKTLSLNNCIQQGLLSVRRSAPKTIESTTIRSHVLDMLLQLVEVHRELYAMHLVSEEISTMLEDIVEGVVATLDDKIKHIIAEHSRQTSQAVFQLLIEVDFVKSVLQDHLSDVTESTLDSIYRILERSSIDNFNDPSWKQNRAAVLKHAEETTKAMFDCFRTARSGAARAGG